MLKCVAVVVGGVGVGRGQLKGKGRGIKKLWYWWITMMDDANVSVKYT